MVYGPLNDQQFRDYSVQHGGGSLDLHTRSAQMIGVDKGYAVAYKGYEETLDRAPTAMDFASHRQRISSDPVFMSRQHPMQGAWIPKGENRTVLDASELELDRNRAVVQGRKRGEEAIFDIQKGRDISLAKTKPPVKQYREDGQKREQRYIGSRKTGFDQIDKPVRKRANTVAPITPTRRRSRG